MPPHSVARSSRTRRASVIVRRFSGPAADQVFVLCRPGEGMADAAAQAESVYDALLDTLAAEGVGQDAIVSEAVFLRRIGTDLEPVRAARSRAARTAGPPPTTFIGQPPLATDALLELSAAAVVARPGIASSIRDVTRAAACPCAACAPGVHARVLRLGDETSAYAGNIHGSGGSPLEDASEMFRAAEDLLRDAGMGFGDVVRTWIHVRDIDRDYAALNRARRDCFRRCGLERLPASTGVQGIPFPDAHAFSMSLYAVKSSGPLDVTAMSTPFLNEAWSYGADFSRGLRLVQRNGVTLHVSGTASVDEAGRTVHAGDVAAQVERMLANLGSLLAGQGASFADVVSGVTYLKNADDARVLRALLRRRGLEGFPCAQVEAPLCRPELMCEMEVLAMLRPPTAAAR